MKAFTPTVTDIHTLKLFLGSPEILNSRKAKVILLQVFSSQTKQTWIEEYSRRN